MIDKNRLYTRRKSLGLTLEEVANIVGVSKSTVRKWETGYIENMKRDKIALLAKALKTTPYFIMGIEPTEERQPMISLQEQSLLNHFNKLNSTGKDEAVKRVEELTHFNKYTDKEDYMMPIAAHNDHPLTEEELELMRQDLEDM